MSRATLISLVTSLTLSVGATGTRAEPAAGAAAARCKVASFSPHSTTVGLRPLSVRFGVRATGCPVRTWQLAVERQPVASAAVPNASLDPRTMHNTNAGSYNISIWVAGRAGGTALRDFPASFRILRGTSWTEGKTPKTRIVKGAAVDLKANLRRVDWNQHRYNGFPRATVQAQFRPSSKTSWRRVRTVTASPTGAVAVTVRPTTTGSWRLVFLGNQTSAGSVTPAHTVTVRPAVTRQAAARPVT